MSGVDEEEEENQSTIQAAMRTRQNKRGISCEAVLILLISEGYLDRRFQWIESSMATRTVVVMRRFRVS